MVNTTVNHTAHEQAHLDRALGRFQDEIQGEVRRLITTADGDPALGGFYGQMAYHLGWLDRDLQPIPVAAGKLMRPALVLWACELAAQTSGAKAPTLAKRHQQAMPAAAAVELVHNFSLIHDDIEDRDALRRGRPTVWAVWGEPQAINAGDGMFALAHMALWESAEHGLPAKTTLTLARLLDATCLRLCEGQYLDMAAEASATITPARYLDMIARKTAALMRAATTIGATIGDPSSATVPAALGDFGEALGIAFQLRDDLLGIWAADTALGKAPAGDLRRKKMTLPVIHTIANAAAKDRDRVLAIYHAPGEPDAADIAFLLTCIGRTSHAWCQAHLAAYCATARAALARTTATGEAMDALGALVEYVAIAAQA
jgi:geranylgeranyl diphosphate synthase type I